MDKARIAFKVLVIAIAEVKVVAATASVIVPVTLI